MTYVTQQNITEQVLEVFEKTPDPRLREVMQSLVKHLHAFVREVEPSDSEFEKGCEFLVGLGKNTSEKKNEVILASSGSRLARPPLMISRLLAGMAVPVTGLMRSAPA